MLKGLLVDCLIGVYPHEKTVPQPLIVDLQLDVAVGPAVQSDDLADAVDYAALYDDVKFILVHGRFQLLESAAAALCGYLLAPLQHAGHAKVFKAKVTIRKPEALAIGGPQPAVSMQLTAGSHSYKWRRSPLCDSCMTLFTNARMTLTAQKVPANGQTPVFSYPATYVAEKPAGLGGGIWLGKMGEEPMCEAAAQWFAPGGKRYYRNVTTRPVLLLMLAQSGEGDAEIEAEMVE